MERHCWKYWIAWRVWLVFSFRMPRLKTVTVYCSLTSRALLQYFSASPNCLFSPLPSQRVKWAWPSAFKASADSRLSTLFSQYFKASSTFPSFSQQRAMLQLLKPNSLMYRLTNSLLACSNSAMAFWNWTWCIRKLPLRWWRQGCPAFPPFSNSLRYWRASQYCCSFSSTRAIRKCWQNIYPSPLLVQRCFLNSERLFSVWLEQKQKIELGKRLVSLVGSISTAERVGLRAQRRPESLLLWENGFTKNRLYSILRAAQYLPSLRSTLKQLQPDWTSSKRQAARQNSSAFFSSCLSDAITHRQERIFFSGRELGWMELRHSSVSGSSRRHLG